MILVTGATGFLGKHVCRRLEQSGRAFSRTSISLGTDLRDFDQTVALLETVRPKAVLNCASFAGGIWLIRHSSPSGWSHLHHGMVDKVGGGRRQPFRRCFTRSTSPCSNA